MPYRGDIFTQGQYYHIYNRGAGKGKIFFNEGSCLYLLRLIKEYAPKFGVAVIAYCLMPNHLSFSFAAGKPKFFCQSLCRYCSMRMCRR